MKRIALALTAIAGLAVTTAAAAPQDEWTQQVRRLLQGYAQRLEGSGYSMTHQIYTGALNDDSNEYVTLRLDIGTTYQIMGACDTDCTDLDFTLYGPNGAEVDTDVELDDIPVVSVTPSRSGTYRLKVVMAACSAEPCRYGVGVFGK